MCMLQSSQTLGVYGGKGYRQRLKPDYQHANSRLEVTAPETTASSRSATLATPEPWGKKLATTVCPSFSSAKLLAMCQCGATTIVPDTNGSYNATYCLTNPTTVLFHPVSWPLSHVTSCFGVRTAHSNNKWSLVLW